MPKDKETNSVPERLAKLETEIKYLKYIVFGSIAANIGIQFTDTPWYVVVATYTALLCGVFLSLVTVFRWKYLSLQKRIICPILATFILFSTVVRTFVYKVGMEPAPGWYSPAIDVIMIVICVALITTLWNNRK